MRSNTAPKNDDTPKPQESEPSAVETFAWPPSDDVLQKMAVIDFVTGETRPLELKPPTEPESRLPPDADANASAAESGTAGPQWPSALQQPGTAGPVPAQGSAAAGAARARGAAKMWTQTTWVMAGVVVVAIAAGVFGAWKLLAGTALDRQPTVTSAAQRIPAPPSMFAPSSSPQVPAPSDKAEPTRTDTKPATGASGSLTVHSDTAGARVWIDGVGRGRTPLNAADLLPGPHTVAVEGPAGRIQQTITVSAGSTTTVFVSAGAGAVGGISVSAASEIEVREGGRVVGTSRAERILLEPGPHTLDFVNDTLGYASRQVVDVVPGKFQLIPIQFPDGVLNINALPWAEVFVDGQRVGETPIGNLKVRVGTHQVRFRHPDLGETTRSVDVTVRGPARISVNLERKER